MHLRLGRRRAIGLVAGMAASTALAVARPAQAAPRRTIHLYGDSIMRGYALGRFEPPRTDPLYGVHSPEAIIRSLLAVNRVRDVAVAYRGVLIGGVPGSPVGRSVVFPQEIRRARAAGMIQPGDAIVMEDAGPHGDDPAWYEGALHQLREAATDTLDVDLYLLTTPAYSPAPADSRWDIPLAGGRTMNQVVRDVATAARPYAGRTYLVDWAAEMDRRRDAMLALDGLDPYLVDGIHPNVWGQMVLVRLILDAADLRPRLDDLDVLEMCLAGCYQLVGYGAPNWTADRARDYLRWLLVE